MKGYLERQVFVLFFVITFATVFLLTFISWQIISIGIKQSEDRDINGIIASINKGIQDYSKVNFNLLQKITETPEIILSVKNNDLNTLNDTRKSFQKESDFKLLIFYDNNGNFLAGDRFEIVEEHIEHIIKENDFQPNRMYPVLAGQDIYMLFVDKLVSGSDPGELLGFTCIVELLRLEPLNLFSEHKTYLFRNIDAADHLNLPERYRSNLSQFKKKIASVSNQRHNSKTIRLGIELGGGLLIKYDIYSNPILYIFFTYNRDLNHFAHKGVLVFMLILLSTALLIITFSGTWFKGKIISPIKDVSSRMKEIEKYPTKLEPMEKKYEGILGDLVDTFNSMNTSLKKYSHSLMVYKTITDNLDSGILWMDSDFKIILCNPCILKIFNYESKKEVCGKNLTDLIELDHRKLSRAKKEGISINRFELNTNNSHKFVKFVIFSVKKTNDQSGLRHIAGIYDITKETQEKIARERIEYELMKSNRLAEIGRLAEGIIHNINSPLNSIIGYSQLIKKRCPENKDIDKILNAGSNIAAIVKNLLNKVKKDNISTVRPLDINNLISLELAMCKHNIFFSQNVILETSFSNLKKRVYASHADISICVANIIDNAIQSMKTTKKRILTVRTEEQDSWTVIRISDTGIGIPNEDIPSLFDPDYSFKVNNKKEGFGLGLAISKNIIAKYEGKIDVTSEVGKGSCFTIILPNIEI